MKKVLLMVSLLVFTGFVATAQSCDKKYKLKTERIFSVQEDGSEGDEVPLTAEITISKDSLIMSLALPDGNAMDLTGKHSSTDCKMNADYTEGTIEWKTDAEINQGGQVKQNKMIFKLEAKGGKLKLYGYPEDSPAEKICFQIKEKEDVK